MKRLLRTLLALASMRLGAAEPLKVLLITGGCCHDYATQKDLLKTGLEERANIRVDLMHSAEDSKKPAWPILGHADYARGYAVVIHDECAREIGDVATVEALLQPHRDGLPGVALHCAIHSFVTAADPAKPQAAGTPGALWFEFLGLQSSRHEKQLPIAITVTDPENPINQGCSDWTTASEELYNNVQIFPTARALWRGRQGAAKDPQDLGSVVAWTNTYLGKTRVFATTIGHNNLTVSDDRYLDFVTRGVLWACDKLGPDGQPKPGYGPGGK